MEVKLRNIKRSKISLVHIIPKGNNICKLYSAEKFLLLKDFNDEHLLKKQCPNAKVLVVKVSPFTRVQDQISAFAKSWWALVYKIIGLLLIC